jgi:formylglycine-generating enzyme required for sulfatase activity
MHGNVAEWTSSPFVGYPNAAASEAFDPELRVIRGGSWYQRQHRATSAWRWGYPTWQRPYNVGFRVVVED